MNNTRVVITGFGSCSAAGRSIDLWEASLNKKNSLSLYDQSSIKDCPVKVVGKVSSGLEGLFPGKVIPFISRHALLGAASLKECLDNAGNPETDKSAGLLFGSSSHGQDQVGNVYKNLKEKPFNKIDYNTVNSISNSGACHLLASNYHISGYVHAVEGASCSGMISVLTGYNLIQSGLCERVFCAAGEANLFPATFLFYARKARISGVSLSFFGRLKNPEPRTPENTIVPFCSPNESDRGAIAEGGGAVLLESLESAVSRGAEIYGEIEGTAHYFHSDNYHAADNNHTGLRNVLSKFKDVSIDSVYLPITGCYTIDMAPYTVCSGFFPGVHTFTAEPVIGHTGAANSLINMILALYSIRNDTLLPTRNLNPDKFDPAFKLKPSSEPDSGHGIKKILVLSSGWGGYNSACVIKKYPQ